MENEIEKKAAQLRHRKEEVEARNRVKERKQRTRRLIIEGALLESCCPEVKTMYITDALHTVAGFSTDFEFIPRATANKFCAQARQLRK